MKELLILSGKGGAGKTSITACFAQLCQRSKVLIDCDVDASNLPLLLTGKVESRSDFYAGNLPEVDRSRCSTCGACLPVCRFEALSIGGDGKISLSSGCEGCGSCADECPVQALTLRPRLCGSEMISDTPWGKLFHAELLPGAENSGKLIASLRQKAKNFAAEKGCELIISDGPPGIGCPVISAATGVDHAVIVTEPTLSGVHDMQRLATLLRQFEINFALIINKADLDEKVSGEICHWCERNQVEILGKVPFDRLFSRALTRGETVLAYPGSDAAKAVAGVWEKLQKFMGE